MPTLLGSMIEDKITPAVYSTLSKHQKTRMEAFFMAYACGVIDAKELGANVEYRYASVIRDSILQSFDFMVRLKMATLLAVRTAPEKRAALFVRYGLKRIDSRIVDYLKIHKLYSRTMAFSRAIPRERLIAPDDVFKLATDVVKQVQNTIRATSYKRLAIVAKSNNFDMSDMQADLANQATQIVYRKYPEIAGQHLINFVRRGISNAAINTLLYYQRGKRARVYYTDKTSGNMEQALHLSDLSQIFSDENDTFKLKTNTEDEFIALIAKNKSSRKQRIAMSLIRFESSKRFEMFLRGQGIENVNPQHVIRKFGADAYANFIRRFLKMKKEPFFAMVKRGFANQSSGGLDAAGFARSN